MSDPAGPLVPRVSVLIPTYSRPEHLGPCLDAVLASTFGELEVLVGDDGSLGRAVCEERPDARLRYIANPERLGMAGNWNSLLDAARGEYVALCMDDDRLHAAFLERCVQAFDADATLSVVFTNHTFAGDGEPSVRPQLVNPGRHDNFACDMLRTRPVAISAALIKRTAWESVRPLPDTAAADMVLFGRLAENGCAFFYIDEPLMTYGLHDKMLSGTDDFRSECVKAWSVLSFSSPKAERERRRLLATSLVSRARLHLRHGRRSQARADLRRATSVGGGRSVASTLPTAIIACLPDRAIRMLVRTIRR